MGFLLLENGSKLLLEDGGGLLLEDTVGAAADVAVLAGTGSLSATGWARGGGSHWLVLGELFLDSGTEYLAGGDVNHPTRSYAGRVLNWGMVDRSIPSPSGLPQVSDAQVRLVDTDRHVRDTLANQTPRRRVMKLKLLQAESSESAAPYFYVGEVVDFDAGSGYCDIFLRDQTFAWLDEEIPSIGNRENFPELAEGLDSFFFPIITGIVQAPEFSPAVNPQGVIPLPHIGFSIANGDRWAVACHPIFDLLAVYRKESFGSPVQVMFVPVDPGEFNVTVEARTIEGVDYHLTFLDFLLEQPAGTEIRADVSGIGFRGGWNGYPAVGYDAVDNPSGTPGALRNAIDFFINMTFLVMKHAGSSANFHAGLIMAIRDKFDVLGYRCDAALTESMTCREFLARFLAAFELDLYVTSAGLIALNFTDEADAGRPLFTDKRLILRGSYTERLANPTANQCRYVYSKNYATEEWASQKVFNNVPDQLILGKVETDTLENWFVRDDFTALDVVTRRMSFLAMGSYRQEFVMPLPEVSDLLELARLIGISHREGFGIGGYTNQEAKILGITADLDKLTVTVRSILRVPQTIVNLKIGAAVLSGVGSLIADATGELGIDYCPPTDPAELLADDFSTYTVNVALPSGSWEARLGGTGIGMVVKNVAGQPLVEIPIFGSAVPATTWEAYRNKAALPDSPCGIYVECTLQNTPGGSHGLGGLCIGLSTNAAEYNWCFWKFGKVNGGSTAVFGLKTNSGSGESTFAAPFPVIGEILRMELLTSRSVLNVFRLNPSTRAVIDSATHAILLADRAPGTGVGLFAQGDNGSGGGVASGIQLTNWKCGVMPA